MKSQWESLLENLGEWEGSFTRLSPAGEIQEDTPTVVSLVSLNHHQTIRQTIRRLTQPPQETVLEYSSLGRGVLFFENGAFSQGSLQYTPAGDFGAELGLIAGDRRLRLVQLYDRGTLQQLTLIRERRIGKPDQQPGVELTLSELVGIWEGEATTLYPDWRQPDCYSTRLSLQQLDPNQLRQERMVAGHGMVASTASIHGNQLKFEQGTQPVQVLLLPGGASATGPTQIQSGKPYFLEVGWLIQPNLRQRLIRSYDAKGAWVSLTLVTEHRLRSL
jgi:hypothetical protein